MSLTRKSAKTSRGLNLNANSTRARRFIAQALALLLFTQAIAPSALAAPGRGPSFETLAAFGSRASATFAALFAAPVAGAAAGRKAAVPAATVTRATQQFGLVLTPLGTAFNGHAGIDHHQPLRKVLVSANNPTGAPLNFEALDADGTHRPFTNLGGLAGELKIALARDDGQGVSLGGFKPGEMFTGTGVAGVVARVSPDGAAVQNPWVTLPGEPGLPHGLYVDRTNVFGGDLVVVTTAGGVWRVNSAGAASRLADLGTALEGVTTVPDDATKYGPWAGRVLVGAPDQSAAYGVDAQGQATSYQLGLAPQDIRVIPAHENFYGLDPAGGKIWGASDDAFAGIIGDILVAQGTPGVLARVRWNGAQFEVGRLAEVESWEQTTFSPAPLAEIGGVKQVYDKIAVVRHAPDLDSGRVEGALWQLTPETVALDGNDVITSDLLVPGTPQVSVGSGKPSFGGVIEGVESAQPTGYSVTISNNAVLRHVITRTNPITLAPVNAPPPPAGARDVSLSKAGESIGDPATLRHLSLSGKAGAVAVPPGTYGRFSAGGHTALVLGAEGLTTPSVYNLEELSLSGGSELRLAGPVQLNVKGNVSLAGSTAGAASDPRRLVLSVAQGSVGVTGGAVLYGIVRIPRGTVSIGGNGRVRGTVTCDRLHIHGNGVLQITESDVPPPAINRPPTADAGPDQTITLPNEVVSLNGAATDDGLPAGSTLTTRWTKVSGPVTFADAASAVTTANFTEPGIYTLRLTASDSLLTAYDEMTVEVIPRNQPPVVDAGPDQPVELPNTATLGGAITDDGLPRGPTVTKTWGKVSGPGEVTFADPHDLSTVVTFAAPGVYTLRLTADDTEFTVSDELVITVYPENQPPTVNAGPDQSLRIPNAAALNGTAADDGLPPNSTLTTKWTKVNGPGAVTFASDSSPVTTATFSAEGTYTLRLTADDTRFTVSDECVVTVLPQNAPPIVSAGPDREITFLEALTLNGTASDDGLPVGSVLEVAWTQVSGPGVAAFASPESTTTAVTFSAPGTYVLRLTGDDTQFTSSDEATLVVKTRPHASRVYTLNNDFDQGSLISVTHSTADQLQLDDTTRSFNFIWVAVSTKGTVVKINTETGAIIGEYHTAPAGQPTDPSRTTVDQNGNVWATNRAGNSVVHIGLVENGQCVDRNNNGTIETSTGFNDIKPWTNAGGANTNGGVTTAQDECLLHYTRVNSFGTRHVSVTKENDIWVSGTGGQKFDLIDGKTGVIKRSEPSVGYGGYGGLIDRNGVIWSANPMLRWDTSKPLTGSNNPLNGMAFTLFGGRATWDRAGKTSSQQSERVWVEDRAPEGAALAGDSEGWNWVSANPAPFSGSLAHQSNIVGGLHQHYFYGAADTLSVGTGESLFAYVYLDPANPPKQVMLQWNNGDWEHRAYWGENLIGWGVDGTQSRRRMGPLPALGQWVRLEVPASQVGLEGSGSNWRGYSHPSYGLCIDSQGNVYNTSYGNGTIRKFDPNGTLLASYSQGSPWAQGCVVDRNDHVWIAHSLSASSVGHMKSDGAYVGTIPVGSGPTGVAVDGAGKVWATNYYSGTVSRINPAAGPLGPDGVTRVGAVDFTTPYLGGNPYNYSDMTGSTLTGAPLNGTWSTVFDSQMAGAEWGRIGWRARVCGDGALTVSVATSENNVNFTQPVVVSNGDDPVIANGRYARITVRFERASSGESPVLYDLSIGTVGFPLDTPANVAPGVDAGPDQSIEGVTKAALRASVCDDALPSNKRLALNWSQVSGPGTATFAKPNAPATEVTFSAVGTYTLRFTASDSVHTTGDTLVVTVIPGNQAPVVNAGPDQTVSFVSGSTAFIGDLAKFNAAAGSPAVAVNFDDVAAGTDITGQTVGGVRFDFGNQPAPSAPLVVVRGADTVTPSGFSSAPNPSTNKLLPTSGENVLSPGGAVLAPGPNPPTENDDIKLSFTQPVAAVGFDLLFQSLDCCSFVSVKVLDAGGQIIYHNPSFPTGSAPGGVPGGSVFFGFVSPAKNIAAVVIDEADGTADFPDSNVGIDTVRISAAVPDTANTPLAGTVTDDGLPAGSTLTATWLKLSGPGLVTFADAHQPKTTAAFAAAGTYVLRLEATDTQKGAFDDVTITVQPRPNRAPEFTSQPVTELELRADSQPPATATYTYDVEAFDFDGDAITYSLQTPPSGMTINPTTGLISWPVTSAIAGVYNIVVRAQDSKGAVATQAYILTIYKPNQAPVVSAGQDRTISISGTATLDGTVTDDGLPRSGTLTSSWIMVNGPGAVTFANPANPATTATFSEAGVYTLRLTANDTALAASDEVVVTVTPPNKAPSVNAGPDLTVTIPGAARLNGSATDDGLPLGAVLGYNWAKVSGPGDVAFANAGSAQTTATFTAPGSYVLRLTASDTELSGSDDVSVAVNPFAPNQAPAVEAGAELSVSLSSNLVRNAGNDEQLVSGEISQWAEAAGNAWTRAVPGTNGAPESVNGESFFYAGESAAAELRQDVDVSAFAATIAAGTQAFEWKAFIRSRAEAAPDTARIIFEYRNASNTATIAHLDSGEIATTNAWHLLEDTRPAPAGTGWVRIRLIATRKTGATNDAFFDALSLRPVTGAGVKLFGVVTDDGLPAAGSLSTSWTKVSGPGAIAFADASSPATSATFAEAGTYVLRLTASDSELSGADELTVNVGPANAAPAVNAGPDQAITLPAPAALAAVVTDDGLPAGAPVTHAWTKVSGPGAVTFTDANAVGTAATFAAAGTYVLRLTANDTEYASSDTMIVTVNPQPPNQPPTVNAGADQLINPPATSVALVGTVTDDGQPDGGSLTYAWTKISGLGSVTFGSPAALSTTATFSEAGAYVLRLTANDSQASGSDDVRVTLNGTNKAPTVSAGPDLTFAHSSTVTLAGTVTDDGLPADSTPTHTWSAVSGPGSITFGNAGLANTTASFSAPGTYVLRLTASDTELTASDDVTVTQTAPPAIGISSPAEGSTITTRTNIIGSVSDGSNWRVEYSLEEEGVAPAWTTLASGSTPVTNGLLATFDPTVLLNGTYTVRLVATNASNQTSTINLTALVDGEQKVGNFSLSFTDLSVPMAGLPIEVVREYDSRDKRVGDFGVGWTVGLRNVRLQESGRVGADWQGTVSGGFFPSYCAQPSRPHVVTVTMPTGKLYKFEAVLGPQCSTLYPLRETTISYRPMAGTNATLAPVGDTTVFVNSNFPGPVELLDYDTFATADFDEYRLTLPNGEVMLISQQAGLRQLSDASGNTLTVTTGGIHHSSGKSIAFARDARGRITRITDPAGNEMSYGYDANGDLVSFRDRENNTTTFTYNSSHGLLSVKDPRGKQPLRTEYDAQGRVVRQIDANGKVINLSHDTDNRRELTTDRMGNTTVLDYNARGQVVRITDPEGNVTTRTYDSRDNLLSETSPLGKTTGFAYDARNNKLSETDPLGNITRYSYNERDQVLTVTNALGHVTTNTYDAGGNLLSTKNALNQTTTYTYTAKGQIASKTDPLGNVTRFEYDASGNLTRQTDALGNVTTNTYDANGNRLTQTVGRTNASGAAETLVTIYEYDRLGNLLKTTSPDGSVTESTYDSVGKQVATRDQLGRQTRYEYDDLGQMTRVTFADGTSQESTFDAEGRLLTVKDRAGRVTTNTYDALGRPVKVTHPDGSFTSKTYDALGRVTAETDERGNTTRYEYDPNCGCSGRRTKVIDALGNSTSYTFDAAGNVSTMTDAKGNVTRYEYDANNRRTRVVHPDNTAEVTAYDAAGRVGSKTDQASKITRFEYDREGRLVKVIDALGQETRYAYDEVGNLRSQTDANNRTTAFEYDRAGRRVKRTLPLGMSEALAYDAAGNLTGRTNFKGEVTTYAYDSMNRLTRKAPDARLNQPAVVFTYGPTGKRASMVDATGTTTYTYDTRDRRLTKQTPQGTLTYTYDATGRLAGMSSSNAEGVSVAYTYDALKRLSAATDHHQQGGTTSYSYDANGNLAAYALPNGVQSAFTYNSLNRLTNLDVSNGAPLAGYAYTLGAAGNRLSVAELGGRQVAYAYDALYRLTGETVSGAAAAATNGSVAYTYDPVGNRLSRSSTVAGVPPSANTYDANDRPAGDTYDADGNLTASAGATYGYTFEDRLSEVNGGAISLTYDGDGNRVARTVGGLTTKYLVDDLNLTGYAQVVEELVGGSVERVYTYGHDLLSQRRRTGAGWVTSHFGYDGAGSVRFLTDQAGAVTDTYDFDAFGTLIARTGATPNEYLYAGEQFDANVGFYYLRARYMNPATGRFLTRDTHEGSPFDPLTLHKYLYTANDPVNKTDPSGMMWLGELALAGGGTMAGRAADGAQKLSILAWVKFTLAAIGIGFIAITAAELIKRAEFPIRLHHYTDFRGLMYIMNPLPGKGGINSPSGTNFFSPDVMWSSDTAEDRLAVCKELDVRITVDIYITRDSLNWPPTPVTRKTCPPGSSGGWGGKTANGGGKEVTTGSVIPFYSRKPIVVPLF